MKYCAETYSVENFTARSTMSRLPKSMVTFSETLKTVRFTVIFRAHIGNYMSTATYIYTKVCTQVREYKISIEFFNG